MKNIEYIGESLFAGNLGSLALTGSFVFVLLSCIMYGFATFSTSKNTVAYKNTARISFWIHSLAVITAICALFYMLANHLFEYQYVWQHSSRDMPMRYIFSCFWEGQEGSFILWIFWHVVLGNLLIKLERKLEPSVMFVFTMVQVFLTTMVLGVYFGDSNIGSNPFAFLLREHPDFFNLPIFENENYLSVLDGRGLNPLLQNYWMTIHPPTLFLGFASVTVPFAYVMSSVITRDYRSWLKNCIPWTYFSIAILGVGILMGGAWAYEALSFGGFWAWDPVENASMVPWLILVGAGHIMLITKNRKISYRSAVFFTYLSFLFVLYSTFLTRSGILGETSVHAFVDLGLNTQLLVFLLFFTFIPIIAMIYGFVQAPKEQEEAFWSKEFWMFLGAIILLVTAFLVIANTSLPVYNKLFDLKKAPKSDLIAQYHLFTVPLTMLLGFIMGSAQLLKYRKTQKSAIANFIFPVVGSLIISAAISILIGKYGNGFGVGISFQESDISFLRALIPYTTEINAIAFFFLLLSVIYVVLANIEYAKKLFTNKIAKAGSAIAHAGFALLLLGALISMSQQKVISYNTSGIDVGVLGEELNNQDNILMYRNDTLRMDDYYISYQGMNKEGINIKYKVEYFNKNNEGKLVSDFALYPTVQTNPRMGNVSEPDTRHFLHKDIYTHVTYALLEEIKMENKEEYSEKPKLHKMHEKDTVFSSNAMIILESINKAASTVELGLEDTDIAVGAFLTVKDMNSKSYIAKPIYVVKKDGHFTSIPAEIDELGLLFRFIKIDPKTFEFDIEVYEKNKNYKEFIVMKAISFPGINILWAGCLIMALGIFTSIYNRIRYGSK